MLSKQALLANISQLLGPLLTDEELKTLDALPVSPESIKSIDKGSVNAEQLNLAKSEVLRLYDKQEYFRNAYNETLGRMHSLLDILPKYSHEYLPKIGDQQMGCLEESEQLPSNSFDPELVDFMVETMRHQKIRDSIKPSDDPCSTPSLNRAPPQKIQTKMSKTSTECEIENICASMLHYYEYSCPCRDAPFWPNLPLARQ